MGALTCHCICHRSPRRTLGRRVGNVNNATLQDSFHPIQPSHVDSVVSTPPGLRRSEDTSLSDIPLFARSARLEKAHLLPLALCGELINHGFNYYGSTQGEKGTRDPHEPLWRQSQVPPVPNRWKLSRERHGVLATRTRAKTGLYRCAGETHLTAMSSNIVEKGLSTREIHGPRWF